jgi:hypothetical protein
MEQVRILSMSRLPRKIRTVNRWRKQHPDLPKPERGNSFWGSQQWWNQCGQKLAHKTFDAAMRCVSETRHRHNYPVERCTPLVIYVCPWCDWYHVGHQGKRNEGVVYVDVAVM